MIDSPTREIHGQFGSDPLSALYPKKEILGVDESLWIHFRTEWRKIRTRWQFTAEAPEDWESILMMRQVERAQLIADVREAVKLGFSGPYPIVT